MNLFLTVKFDPEEGVTRPYWNWKWPYCQKQDFKYFEGSDPEEQGKRFPLNESKQSVCLDVDLPLLNVWRVLIVNMFHLDECKQSACLELELPLLNVKWL